VLVRPDGGDMFGFGSREAVVAALAQRDATVFGSPALAADLAIAVTEVLASAVDVETADDAVSTCLSAPYDDELSALHTLAFAFGWTLEVDPDDGPLGIGLRFRPGSP
jgi:coenzyme F420-0:L-glutamate ligase / coenzyme F420-1:gamma-L-glutamate ligase